MFEQCAVEEIGSLHQHRIGMLFATDLSFLVRFTLTRTPFEKFEAFGTHLASASKCRSLHFDVGIPPKTSLTQQGEVPHSDSHHSNAARDVVEHLD